jgi:sugar diacid utilization regulator
VALENARLYDQSQHALHDLTKAYATIEAAGVVHEALTQVVLAGGDVGAVADVLVDALGGSVLVLDRANRVVAARGQPADDDDRAIRQDSTLTAASHLAAPLAQCIDDSRRSGHCVSLTNDDAVRRSVAAIVAGASHMGALIYSRRGDLESVELRTLERAAQITALLILTQDALVNAEERVRGELLTQLFVSQLPLSSELTLRARARHVEIDKLDAVLVIQTEDAPPGDTVRVLHGLADRYRGLAGEHLGIPTAVIHADDLGSAARHVHEQLRRILQRPVVVCAAPIVREEPFGRAFTLASRCCRVLRELGIEDADATTQDLALYAILFDPDRGQDLTMFLDRTIGKLVEHDAKRGTDLTGTLAAYFANSGNITHTARALRIHPNTLLKRMERIGGLLGRDWQRPDAALELQLAVHLYDLAHRTWSATEPLQGNA